MIAFFCQICGKLFETEQYEQRCCSWDCSGELCRRRRVTIKDTPIGPVQGRILQLLRDADGAEVSQIALADALYGSTDANDRRAIGIAVHRLRKVWGPHGLAVATRQRRWRLDADGETFYRLVQDFDETLGVAV